MSGSTLSLLQRVTAMISALFVTAAAAQQTPPQPQQAPTTAPALAPRELPPVIARWQQAVVARLARFQRYPAQAKGATGVVNLNFSIDRQGHVLNSEIIRLGGTRCRGAFLAHTCRAIAATASRRSRYRSHFRPSDPFRREQQAVRY